MLDLAGAQYGWHEAVMLESEFVKRRCVDLLKADPIASSKQVCFDALVAGGRRTRDLREVCRNMQHTTKTCVKATKEWESKNDNVAFQETCRLRSEEEFARKETELLDHFRNSLIASVDELHMK